MFRNIFSKPAPVATPAPPVSVSSMSSLWLAGVYERNPWQQALLGFDILHDGATAFSSREEAAEALSVPSDHPEWSEGGGLVTTDAAAIDTARRRLPRQALIDPRGAFPVREGRYEALTLFVQPAPHLAGAQWCVYSLSEEQRDIASMVAALTPVSSAAGAVEFLEGAVRDARDTVSAESLVPNVADEWLVDRVVGMLSDPAVCREGWHAFVGGVRLGVVDTSRWSR